MAAAAVSAFRAAISSGVTISPRCRRLSSADIWVRKFSSASHDRPSASIAALISFTVNSLSAMSHLTEE
jgi:hypothetical protein